MKEEIRLSKKELNRYEIIQKVLNRQIDRKKGAELLELSYRHIKRIVKRVEREGAEGLIHKNRGKPSAKKFPDSKIQEILNIYINNYPDFKPLFATEKLEECHNIKISSESLRKILINADIWKPKKRNAKNTHIWRERKEHCGEMIQVDGSHHRWLEDRLDQEFCLMAYIDDATGKAWGKFYEYEGVLPALDSFIEYSKIYGFPHSVYLDGHSTYKTTRQPSTDELLRNEYADTQFERIMKNIGVIKINARSPQAKGRVERLFKTLQDRLIKEMRLANICTIEAANKFLETFWSKFNSKYAIEPKKHTSLFKQIPDNFDYKWIFSIQDKRTVLNDFTVRWKNRLFLLLNRRITLKKTKVFIQQSLDGDIRIVSKHNQLSYKEITEKDYRIAKSQQKQIIKILKSKNNSYKKSKKHWMDNFYIGNKSVPFKDKKGHFHFVH